MEQVAVYETPKATVRIHPSKMAPDEFRANLEAACRKFYSDIKKSESKKEKKNV
jgi:hypothetical protein